MNSEKKVLFSKDFRDLEYLWKYEYNHKEWKIVRSIQSGFNWSRLSFGYTLIIRELTEEEKNNDFYRYYDGDIFKAMRSAVGKGIEAYQQIQQKRKNRNNEQ